jgi:hypothetical protein
MNITAAYIGLQQVGAEGITMSFCNIIEQYFWLKNLY